MTKAPSKNDNWQSFCVKLPRELHYELRLYALNAKISATALVAKAVETYLREEGAQSAPQP